MDRVMNAAAGSPWRTWFATHVVPTVDQQAHEMRMGKRSHIEFEWTSARVANEVVGLPVPDVSTTPWLDNLKKITRGTAD
eukprot:7411595-Karenia_brevis.AAC.1